MILDLILGLKDIPEAEIVSLGRENLKPEDVVLGVVSVEARKLYTIIDREAERIEAEGNKLREEIRTTPNLLAHLDEYDSKIKRLKAEETTTFLMKDVFWQQIIEEIGGTNESGIAVRKGWEVVINSQQPVRNTIIVEGELSLNCGNPDCPNCGNKK